MVLVADGGTTSPSDLLQPVAFKGADGKWHASEGVSHAAAAISAGGFTAINAAASAPTTGTNGGNTGAFSNVLAVLTYSATTLTAARIRLWTRLTGANTAWIPGASSDDFGAPFTPSTDPMKTAQAEQRVFAIGAGVEFLFTLEAISPSGGATVACACYGVS